MRYSSTGYSGSASVANLIAGSVQQAGYLFGARRLIFSHNRYAEYNRAIKVSYVAETKNNVQAR